MGRDTISRWCKNILARSGIDVNAYSSHSSRAAATSKAKERGLSMAHIQKFAGWSNEKTFALFYQKDIIQNTVFQSSIL